MFCIWLLPIRRHENIIARSISSNMAALNMPSFIPHLTLFDGTKVIDDALLKSFRNIIKSQNSFNQPLRLKVLSNLNCDDSYYRSCYMKLSSTTELNYIFNRMRILDEKSTYKLEPHVSLAYSNRCNYLPLLKSPSLNYIDFDRLCIVSDNNQENATAIESWEIIESCKLY